MRNKVTDMTSGSPSRLIVGFALPLMVGNIGQQLYTVVDAIIVGQGVGVTALAALGATDWTYWMFLWAIHGITQGFSILIAQQFGAKDAPGLRKAFTMSVLLGALAGILLTVLGLLIAAPLLRLLNTPENIFGGALSYIRVMFAGNLIVMAYNVVSCTLRALGDGKTPLAAMMIAAAINIGLDLLFVMVFHWGIVGAAAATLIAQLFSFLYCLRAILHIEILITDAGDWKPDRQVLVRLLGLGVPLAMQQAIIAIGGMVLQSVLNGFGFLFVAGFTATNKLYGMLESTAISFGYSMSTYMGQNLGARQLDRIKAGMKSVVKISAVISAVISVTMILLGRHILGLFVSSGDENAAQVIEIAYQYLFIMCALLVILYLLHVYRSSLQGLGNTIAPLLSGVLELIMRVGVSLFLPPLVGEIGIFFAEPAAWAGATAVLMIAYYREERRISASVLCPCGCPPLPSE